MGASLASVLSAARDAAGAQHYPQGALYVVATPIGNLADITLRALHVLQIADAVACEDTRHTQSLLRAYSLDKKTLAVHQHNEIEAAQAVVARLQAGERIAYATDAGTPGVSDPGARLAAAVRAAGLRVIPVPGASSVTAALSAAGAAGDDGSFVFAGFLPTKSSERELAVKSLASEPRAVVVLEAPHRIEALAKALAPLGARKITLARELTKQFEHVETLTCEELAGWLRQDAQRTRGEFVAVLHPQAVVKSNDEGLRVLSLLLAELPVKSAVKLAADITGASRNELYEAALKMKRGA